MSKKISNELFGNVIRGFTTPEIKFKDLDKALDMSPQSLRYHAIIRPALYPNEDSIFTDETIDLCLIKVKQLGQAIEMMSSTTPAIAAVEQQKDAELPVGSFISIINKI